MLSQQFQEAHVKISDSANNLLLYLKEYRQGRLTEGDKTESLQTVEDDIVNALKALKAQRYEVAVVAPMKAGKSTFLNAIVGADVLASESAACTICRTDVCHIGSGETSRLLEYRDSQRQAIIVGEGNVLEIQQKFLERTRKIRNDKSADKEIPSRFELHHPIEAISNLPSLSGFTLIDTPGPNEWKSMSVDTVALKRAALEAMRTCQAVLFLLNYRSFKDNAVSELFRSITENRPELLAESKGRVYFILNQVDLKSEKDPEISKTIDSLKQDLTRFGFPNPDIYPVSALQGLLAKLIQQGEATETHIKDFKKFFSAQYAEENEYGDMIIPSPRKIAPQAVQDSGILAIQETVFQTIVQNSGWNLLDSVLQVLDKAAKVIETTLSSQIVGWEMEIGTLKEKVEEYKKKKESSEEKVKEVQRAVEKQKEILLEGFSTGVDAFANGAKEKIQEEIDRIAEFRSLTRTKSQSDSTPAPTSDVDDSFSFHNFFRSFFRAGLEIGAEIVEELLPGSVGKSLAKLFRVAAPLVDKLKTDAPEVFSNLPLGSEKEFDPYKIVCTNQSEANKVKATINEFCAPHIQSWWIDTQDSLVREGTMIREELVKKIQKDIQIISDELSTHLKDALQVEINVNPIQFPVFEFQGIDAQVSSQQEVYKRTQKQKQTRKRCCDSDEVFYIDDPVEELRSLYWINLNSTSERIKSKIDEQAAVNKALLERVIEKQVNEDFRNAEKQILDYMNRFQVEFDKLLVERDTRQVEAPQIVEALKTYHLKLNHHLQVVFEIKASLDEWKPL